jgi:cobalt-precorrin-5B (C1)-methyltransferase
MDLHSARGGVDLDMLAGFLAELGADADLVAKARAANSGKHVLDLADAAGLRLADKVAEQARLAAQQVVGESSRVSILITDRAGTIVAESG